MSSVCKLEDLITHFAPYIEELQEFFKRRGAAFGAPADVGPFVERLRADAGFRDEMASMVRAGIYQSRDGLARLELLQLILVAVGGPHVDEAAEELHEPARQVLAFVEGAFRSRWNTVHPKSAEEHAAKEQDSGDVEPAAKAEPVVKAEPIADEVEISEVRGAAAMSHGSLGSVAPGEDAAREDAAPEVLRFYRVERSTSEADEAPSRAHLRLEDDEDLRVPVRAAEGERSRAHLTVEELERPGTLLRPEVEAPTFGMLSDESPLEQAPEVEGSLRRWVWTAGFCSLVVVFSAGLFIVQRSADTLPAPAIAKNVPAAPVAQEPVASDLGSTRAENSGAVPPSKPAAAQPMEASQRGVAEAGVQDTEDATVRRRTLREPVEARYVPTALFGVSPAVMSSRLISAPRPEYPRIAKLAHIEGPVVVEAVIARSGRVAKANVLSGHRLLRGAALHAVRERRYRPYMVNGRPTDVATILTVDFRLH